MKAVFASMWCNSPRLFQQLIVALLVALCLACEAATQPLDNWQLRRHLGGSAAVAYGNDRFVVAAYGFAPLHLLVSTNGMDWKGYVPPENGTFVCLKFVNENFLLLIMRSSYPGANNGMALYSSVDGVSWILRRFNPSGFGIPVSSVGGGNGIYVMASSDLSVSTDLVNWRQAVLGASGIQDFASGRGLIIGTPWWGLGFIASSDGLTWEYIPAAGGFSFTSVRFANGRFTAFASGTADGATPPAIAISPYGHDWSYSVMPDYTNFTRLASGNDRFFLLSSSTNLFYSSADALAWEAHSFGTNVAITDLTFGANTYVAVGDAILQSPAVTNAALVPATLSMRNIPGIMISGPVGQAYQIEFAESLSSPDAFLPLTNVVSTTSPFLWLDTAYTNARPRFYRAMTLPGQP